MILDNTLLFSSAQSLVTSTSVASTTVINLSNSRDLGLGGGLMPKVFGTVGTGITSACTSATLTVQFQGSTDSTNWTTYIETNAMTTAGLSASSMIFEFDVPSRPNGAALPQYLRLNYVVGSTITATISTGTITAGIILDAAESQRTLGQYASGFTVQ